jgi:hypothetical protein
MKHFTTIMEQCLQFLPKDKFDVFVGQHKGDHYTKHFTVWNQLAVMLYAQATGKKSLRDLQTGLQVYGGKWHHLGLKSAARSTVADANNRRSHEIFEKLFYALLARCHEYLPRKSFSFRNDLYSLDGTVIDLCLTLFDWAKFRKQKGAIRIHTLFHNTTQIPTFLTITDGKKHEITVTKENWEEWGLEKGSILVFDRGYVDYGWYHDLDEADIFFVTRAKGNMQYAVEMRNAATESGVIKDEIISFVLDDAEADYPERLRLITYWDEERQKELRFLTNNLELSAKTIADIYKERWQIEIFFKWVKQNLRIKTFLGTSKNAVLSQIWIAMIYYLILSYIKAQTKTSLSLLELSRILHEAFFYRVSIIDLLSLSPASVAKRLKRSRGSPQMELF